MNNENTPLLKVRNLHKLFPVKKVGLFSTGKAHVHAVNGVNLDLYQGESLGLVGESGCGKSTLGRTILQLLKPTTGTIEFNGKEITNLSPEEIRLLRQEKQIIFQDPYACLNPKMTVGEIVGEPLVIFEKADKSSLPGEVEKLLTMVGLEPSFANRYPHEFSGGQRQRIGIARALALNPSFIVCDEPISALDVSVQAQVLNLLVELKKKLNLTYLFIAHDLSMVRYISDRIAVMYLGHIVEESESEELNTNPLHPYTNALISAIPKADPEFEKSRQRIVLEGDVPSPIDPPPGCPFCTRCPEKMDICEVTNPELQMVGPNHRVACFKYSSNGKTR